MLRGSGKIDVECRSPADFRLNSNMAFVVLEYRICGCKPQSTAFLLGGKIRIEQFREQFRGYAGSGIGDGYADDTFIANYREYGFTANISKPYRIEELEEVVRDILQNDPGT